MIRSGAALTARLANWPEALQLFVECASALILAGEANLPAIPEPSTLDQIHFAYGRHIS
jgi:hypothetical protein